MARVYDAPERAALQTIMQAAAAEHCVTGESLVRSPDAHEMALCLFGYWGGCLGAVASVTSFIEKVQRFAVQRLRVVCFFAFSFMRWGRVLACIVAMTMPNRNDRRNVQ